MTGGVYTVRVINPSEVILKDAVVDLFYPQVEVNGQMRKASMQVLP